MKWYLCGPFWDKECSEFFDRIIQECRDTKMDNLNNSDEIERFHISSDEVFVPGHFKVDFNKIKSEYSPESFRRVLNQILRLDLHNIDSESGLIVYSKGYDLGSMFELGYFLGINGASGFRYGNLNILRRMLIIKDLDDTLKECIDVFTGRKIRSIIDKYSSDSESIAITNEDNTISTFNGLDYGLIGLDVDVYKDTPFNSILAGYLYAYQIPFFTYSKENNDSNVMMLASSLFHVKLENPEELSLVQESILSKLQRYVAYNYNDLFWDNSYFEKFKNIK